MSTRLGIGVSKTLKEDSYERCALPNNSRPSQQHSNTVRVLRAHQETHPTQWL
jgi:hypothetical protein